MSESPQNHNHSHNHNHNNIVEETEEGTFARNYTQYGLLVVVMLCIIWLWNYLSIGILLFAILAFYFLVEFNVHQILQSLTIKLNVIIPRTKLILYSFISFSISILTFLIYKDSISFFKSKAEPTAFFTAYYKSIILTLFYSNILLGFKLLCLSLNILDLIAFKSGKFGILYRLFFIIRTVSVTTNWIKYFTENVDTEFLDVVFSKQISIASFYVAVKSVFIAGLIWDLQSCYKQYKRVMKKAFSEVEEPCSQCDAQTSLKLLCTHNLCLNCLKMQACKAPYCKVCQSELIPTMQFAFTDGYTSISSIFCCL